MGGWVGGWMGFWTVISMYGDFHRQSAPLESVDSQKVINENNFALPTRQSIADV